MNAPDGHYQNRVLSLLPAFEIDRLAPHLLLGTEGSPVRIFMQISGSGFRIEAESLKAEFDCSGQLRQYLQKYIQALMVQTTQTGACNRLHTIEKRLARWLLTCRDRMPTDRLVLTHEFLGQMLGSPRTTVTLAVGLRERAGMIHHSRGVVTVRDLRRWKTLPANAIRWCGMNTSALACSSNTVSVRYQTDAPVTRTLW
jgi:hypothetical protein